MGAVSVMASVGAGSGTIVGSGAAVGASAGGCVGAGTSVGTGAGAGAAAGAHAASRIDMINRMTNALRVFFMVVLLGRKLLCVSCPDKPDRFIRKVSKIVMDRLSFASVLTSF